MVTTSTSCRTGDRVFSVEFATDLKSRIGLLLYPIGSSFSTRLVRDNLLELVIESSINDRQGTILIYRSVI